MYNWKVYFKCQETGKVLVYKVKATGISPAINEGLRKYWKHSKPDFYDLIGCMIDEG